jgi:large subunit ribosomal protein L9
MLVILRENVENLGQTGDIVNVSPGYARNFLLPKNLGFHANEKNKAAIENAKKMLEKKRQAEIAQAGEVAKKLADFQCTISRKVGENDKIFGSVSNADICDTLKAAGFKVDRRSIVIETPIKALGVHTVTVRLATEVSAPLKVWVVKEA